ncbi:MAG: FAD-dependent oxidoreductase [Adlercreutzia sp.]|nr:FAD-dependent oxidoreductase [Adlercreutzia sp.]
MRGTSVFDRPMTRRHMVLMGAVGAMALALGGCAPQPPSAGGAGGQKALSFTAGTYTGTAEGRGGVMAVEVTFTGSAIEAVRVVEHAETRYVSDVALEKLPAQIVEYQSTSLDTITGATMTSMGITGAVEDAAKQAGGDVSALKKAPSVEKSTETREIDCDVVVVGAGAAGMGCAVAAAQAGANVVVFEKTSNMGGNALVSGGHLEYIYAPDAMRLQMDDGYRSFYDRLLDQARAGGASPSFLEALQADFDAYYAEGKTTVYTSTGLYELELCQVENEGDFSSITDDTLVNNPEANGPQLNLWFEELGIQWREPLGSIIGYTWPHWTGPEGSIGGTGYFDLFVKAMEDQKLPLEMLTCTPASELIVEGGKVVGVTGVCDDGTTYRVRASKGVVLASGGYSGNPEMLKEYNTTWSWDADTVILTDNTAGHTGDGITMALAAGGYVDRMENPMLFPTVDPIQHIIENVVADGPFVNAQGKRFVDETLSRFDIVESTMEQTDQMLYIVSDAPAIGVTEDGRTMGGLGPAEDYLLEKKMLFRADTLEEVAEMAGVDAAGVRETVEHWNRMVTGAAEDAECGRKIFDGYAPIETPPFYIAPATFAAHLTIGGVVADANGAVLTEAGEPVEGLYAAGEVVAGKCGITTFGDGLALARHLTA